MRSGTPLVGIVHRMNMLAQFLEERIECCRRLWGRPEDAMLPDLRRRITILRERESTFSDALLVILMGGTKVGKTTLVNALAGRVVGEASAKACFTSRPTLYVHSSREAQGRARLAGVLRPDDRVECHQESALERIILVDAPDLDGIEATHHEVFDELLARADLALCVVTTQKYDSAALYEILGRKMGFRRTVVVFNRIDEGIPLSDTVRNDMCNKIAAFALKPPEGESLPLFGISASNALAAKQGKPAGPRGDFPALEALLRERLDQTIIRRISEENLTAIGDETRRFIEEACHLDVALTLGPQILETSGRSADKLCAQIHGSVSEAWGELAGAIEGRRSLSIVAGVGGPFGAYLRAMLAIKALTSGFSFSFPSVERLANTITHEARELTNVAIDDLSTQIAEDMDRAGLDPAAMTHRFERSKAGTPIDGAAVSDALRKQTGAVCIGSIEGFMLNLIPILILLLAVRYFAICLLEAREPGAGIFLGCGLLLWIFCHLQAAFWLPRKIGSALNPPADITTTLTVAARNRLIEPAREWNEELDRIKSS
ncbi:MAG: GTPase domain-containing protein [Candidatus Riflebacteria bacterium]|nr:GTPase domain-containing protein [Candidatus Riflebacteria bacterium]